MLEIIEDRHAAATLTREGRAGVFPVNAHALPSAKHKSRTFSGSFGRTHLERAMGKCSYQSFDRGRVARRQRYWPVNLRSIFIPTSVAAIGPAVARRDVAGQFGNRQGVTQNNILAPLPL